MTTVHASSTTVYDFIIDRHKGHVNERPIRVLAHDLQNNLCWQGSSLHEDGAARQMIHSISVSSGVEI